MAKAHPRRASRVEEVESHPQAEPHGWDVKGPRLRGA